MRPALLFLLALLSAGSEISPLLSFSSLSRSESEPGDLVTLTVSLYSTSPTPIRVCSTTTIAPDHLRYLRNGPNSNGLREIVLSTDGANLTWCGVIERDKPLTFNVTLSVVGTNLGDLVAVPTSSSTKIDVTRSAAVLRVGVAPSRWRVLLPLARAP